MIFPIIEGVVVDSKTGKRLDNVDINLTDSFIGTHTNKDGIFILMMPPFGKPKHVNLTISKIGYKPKEVKLYLDKSGKEKIGIELKRSKNI
jgi:hypothetical protein